MAKNTDIGPNDHSPCVEPTPPKRITPEDISSDKIVPSDSPNWKNIPDKPEPLENPDQKAPHHRKLMIHHANSSLRPLIPEPACADFCCPISLMNREKLYLITNIP